MLSLLEILADILAGNISSSRILADWLQDNCSSYPEFETYHRRLLQPESLRLRTILDTVIKFGNRTERKTCSRLIRQVLRDKNRNNSKGCVRAYMKKSWSLKQDWFAIKALKERLGVK